MKLDLPYKKKIMYQEKIATRKVSLTKLISKKFFYKYLDILVKMSQALKAPILFIIIENISVGIILGNCLNAL